VGAPVLSGYIIQGKPCIPIKRFGLESGYYIAVSPSGRIIGIIVNKKISNLVDGTRATTGGRDFPLSIQPLAQNNDFYVPLDFFEKVYPVRFTWNRFPGRSRNRDTLNPLCRSLREFCSRKKSGARSQNSEGNQDTSARRHSLLQSRQSRVSAIDHSVS
jgi:hypothetical protein